MSTLHAKARFTPDLRCVIQATKELWYQHGLTYDQTQYVIREVRRSLGIERPKTHNRAIARLSREEELRLIAYAYRMKGERGLLIKTLFQTGARISEFVKIKVGDVFLDKKVILITETKGGKVRCVPILTELAKRLRTYLRKRTDGYLFVSNRGTCYTSRSIHYLVKETAAQAQITKRVYLHTLRSSIAITLLERGMTIDQIQKFLGHSKHALR